MLKLPEQEQQAPGRPEPGSRIEKKKGGKI
jgi:hypothetical protein